MFASTASAGGQLEHPSEVNSSSTAKPSFFKDAGCGVCAEVLLRRMALIRIVAKKMPGTISFTDFIAVNFMSSKLSADHKQH
jgi:hypothetical protein